MPLAHLPKLHALKIRVPPVKAPSLKNLIPKAASEPLAPALTRPDIYGSAWEQWLHGFLLKQSPYWIAGGSDVGGATQLGRPYSPGSTRADFINQYLKVVLYLDGAYWHTERAGQDIFLEAGWRTKGFRVVRWRALSFAQLAKNASQWYKTTIGL